MTPPSAQVFELIGILKGYEGDFRGAIDAFTQGIAVHPADARLYRHRGHRYMNTRQLEAARADFERALELLPGFEAHYEYGRNYVLWQLGELVLNQSASDVFPDHETVKAAGKYHASLPFKIHYHLGLTQHLLGDNTSAIASFEQALEHSENVDLLVATSNWLVVLYGYESLHDRKSCAPTPCARPSVRTHSCCVHRAGHSLTPAKTPSTWLSPPKAAAKRARHSR
jgi:tetratricopeptide (TPR) repeat protein